MTKKNTIKKRAVDYKIKAYEREKELRCIYDLSILIEKRLSVGELLKEAVKLLPPAWQNPDITCAKIVFEDKEYRTGNFKVSKWKLSTDIKVHGEKKGSVEVWCCYPEEKMQDRNSPFLKEENNLVAAFSQRLGKVIERQYAEEALNKSLKDWQRTFNSIENAERGARSAERRRGKE